jgi:hypothetical protein
VHKNLCIYYKILIKFIDFEFFRCISTIKKTSFVPRTDDSVPISHNVKIFVSCL